MFHSSAVRDENRFNTLRYITKSREWSTVSNLTETYNLSSTCNDPNFLLWVLTQNIDIIDNNTGLCTDIVAKKLKSMLFRSLSSRLRCTILSKMEAW